MRRQLLVGLIGWFGVCAAARSQEPALTTVLVTDGASAPLYVTHAPGDNDRLFIVDQRGQIRIVKCGRLLKQPFLDAHDLVRWGPEEGLLGLAFHPDYAENGQFFINYTDFQGATVIARYHVSDDPDVADPVGAPVLSIRQPFSNHNGGWIDFGPDGYLYIAMGDGGGGYDSANTSQDNTDLLASLLRIDVDGDDFPEDPERNYAIPPDNPFVDTDGADEVWAYGLRNPWRCAFDQLTGALYIGDVGQDEFEEIDVQPADDPGGANYGWVCREGYYCTGEDVDCCADPSLIDPVYVYDHYEGCAIIGGEVYRGGAIPDLQGVYFFSDFCSARIWTFRYVDGKVSDFMERSEELRPPYGGVSSFGRDASGELYICSLAGEVFKIVPVDAAAPLIDSDPPDGAIDARRPFDPDGSNPTGWDSVELVFGGPAPALAPEDFTVEQVGGDGDGDAPTVVDVVPVDTDRVRVDLSRPLSPGAWTTLASCANGVYVRLGYLPADVNGDGVSSAIDILDFIDDLNGVGPPRSDWSLDIDRSGVVNATDVLEIIDLLRGADSYPAYNLARLP